MWGDGAELRHVPVMDAGQRKAWPVAASDRVQPPQRNTRKLIATQCQKEYNIAGARGRRPVLGLLLPRCIRPEAFSRGQSQAPGLGKTKRPRPGFRLETRTSAGTLRHLRLKRNF